MLRVRLEVPAESIGAVLAALSRRGAAAHPPSIRGELVVIESELPAARAQDFRLRRLPARHGRAADEAVVDPEPLNRDEYLLHLERRIGPTSRG